MHFSLILLRSRSILQYKNMHKNNSIRSERYLHLTSGSNKPNTAIDVSK